MMKSVSHQTSATPTPLPVEQAGSWKRDAAVAVTTVAAATAGTYLGAEVGTHFLADHIANATQDHGIFALLTVPVEVLRGMITHIAPWAVGTGTATGMLGYAAGKTAFKGAPLTED